MNSHQALSIAACVLQSHLYDQPVILGRPELVQASVILTQMSATLRPVAETDRARLADLSERELEVLAELTAGYTNDQIAQELYISVNTVKAHLRHIIEKPNVANRAQAIALAVNAGLGR